MKLKNMKTFEEHSSELNISDVRNSENINENIFTENDMELEIIDNDESIIIKISDTNPHSICSDMSFATDKVNIQEIIDSLRSMI
jgi:hypothetical protein